MKTSKYSRKNILRIEAIDIRRKMKRRKEGE